MPFPFRSAAAFESTIRAPVTSTFIPQTAALKLAAPNVISKIGSVIEPMSRYAIISPSKTKTRFEGEEEVKAKGDGAKGAFKKQKNLEIRKSIKSNKHSKQKRLKK